MITSLNEAPVGQPLLVVTVRDQGLARELAKLGLEPGQELIRLEKDASVVRPVRLRGPMGEVILSGNMASGLVVHLDDGRIVPLLEMKPGDKGHLEGVTVVPGSAMAETFQTLGLEENDSVELVRRLPAMEYVTLIDRKKRVNLPGGMAAKLWGESQGQKLQFATAGAAKEFRLEKILGGDMARQRITAAGLTPGVTLILEAVKPAQTVRLTHKDPVAVSTPEYLRFWLPPQAASLLMVREKQPDSDTV
jgi:Fe2+ transport system protein FeoA